MRRTLTALDTKVLRDLWQHAGQWVAIALVLAAGIGLQLCFAATLHTLQFAQAEYYARERFADVTATLVRAPEGVADGLATLPGVQRVQTRIQAPITLDLRDMVEAATGRVLSLPDHTPPAVDGVRPRSGRMPQPGSGAEVLVHQAFAQAHDLALGAELTVLLEGRQQTLRVVGTALSPETIMTVPPGTMFPDDRRFGVFWMRRRALAAAVDLRGAFNSVSLQLAPDASVDETIAGVDRLLAPFGGGGAISRRDQESHAFVQSELDQLRGFGSALPMLFLLVAAFLVHVVVGRLVAMQREQIAALKALGYRNGEVARHYAMQVGVVVVIGAGLGIALGAWMGHLLTGVYLNYYRFPALPFALRWSDVAIAIGLATAAAAAGAWSAVRRTARLAPAEAMRPAAPPSYRPTILERPLMKRFGVDRLLPTTARMVLREMERRPGRQLLSGLGVALATSMVVVTTFSLDSIDRTMNVQFGLQQRADVQLALTEARAVAVALPSLRQLPGVLHVEPFRTVPVRLRAGPRSRTAAITAMPRDATLHALLDADLRDVPLPREGLVLSRRLADVLGVQPGQTVRAEVLTGRRPVVDVTVARTVETYVGLAAYMDLRALCRAMGETPSASGAWLQIDERRLPDLHRAVVSTPAIAGISGRDQALRSLRKILDENIGLSVLINLSFAFLLAAGVLYNVARITQAERARELASLRVLGFRRREVAAIFLLEFGTLLALSIPVGLLVGQAMAGAVVASIETDQFRFPLVIHARTYAMATLTVLVAGGWSAWIAWRGIERMDLIEVLKARD